MKQPEALCLMFLVALVASVTGGCRSVDNAQVDVLERENRQLNDYIWELEDYLLEYSDKLRDCRCSQPAPFHSSVEHGTVSSGETIISEGAVTPAPTSSKSKKPPMAEPELADDTPIDIDEEEVPTPADSVEEEIPTPAPSTPEPESIIPEELDIPELEIEPTSATEPRRNRGLVIPDPANFAEAEPPRPNNTVEAEGKYVVTQEEAPERFDAEQLKVRRLLRGSEEPGSGLLVVVEALTEMNEPVDAVGDLSAMVLTAGGKQKRVERWDFTPDEAAAAWQSTAMGDGLHLELPITRGQLPQQPLELWIRLVTDDGRKLLTKMPFVENTLATLAEVEQELMLVDDRDAQDEFAEQDNQLFEVAQLKRTSDASVQQAIAVEPAKAEDKDSSQWRNSTAASMPARPANYASTKDRRVARWSPGKPAKERPSTVVNPLREAKPEKKPATNSTRWAPFQ
ncbi:MAG: hypothetical protein RIB44_00880 [Lacipirellulaceae bacterium]